MDRQHEGMMKKSLVRFTHTKHEENDTETNKLDLISDLDAADF